jgi:hypothetical protein
VFPQVQLIPGLLPFIPVRYPEVVLKLFPNQLSVKP